MLSVILMAQALSCAHPQTQTDMTQCAGDASARADAAMNAQWKLTLAAMHKLDKDAAGDPPVDHQHSYAMRCSPPSALGCSSAIRSAVWKATPPAAARWSPCSTAIAPGG